MTAGALGRPVRVLHVVTGLGLGGAERQLVALLAASDRERFDPGVIALQGGGELAEEVRALGVPLLQLGLTPATAPRVLRLPQLAAASGVSVVQGWMYHGNLAALLARARGRALLWSVRQCADELTGTKPTTSFLVRLGARLSHVPARIVYNSRESAAQHEALGYARARTVVVPNGFDVARWAPSSALRDEVRRELGLAPDALVVGLFGRLHASKDHASFLRAAALLARSGLDFAAILAGPGVTAQDRALAAQVRELGLSDRVLLLGPRRDVTRLMAALDVLALSSASEAFPNVVGEAMACGVPCVATDVGDVSEIVGTTGLVVPPRDAPALAAALGDLLRRPREARARLGLAARERIARLYSTETMARRYEALWLEALQERAVS